MNKRDGQPREFPLVKRHRLEVPFSLAALEAEVEDVRKAPPSYVTGVGSLSVPSMLCDDNGDLNYDVRAEGPWYLDLSIRGSEDNKAYDFTFKTRIRFDTSWPANHPMLRFRGVFHHALTRENEEMPLWFYNRLPRDLRGMHTVRLILGAVHGFLVDPLEMIGLDSPQPQRLLDSVTLFSAENAKRLNIIKAYRKQVLHPELFHDPPRWREEWFDPAFWAAHKRGDKASWRAVLEEHMPGGQAMSFPLFTDAFCEELCGEIYNFYASGLEARRPNSMNNYGIVLNEIGLEPMIDQLQLMLQPLGELLFPGPGNDWDGHHCFIVRYREGEDLGLDMHTDDSDVTFNVCLGVDFDGAGLRFCGMLGASDHRKSQYTYKHKKGRCIVHLGRRRHGADDVTRGERLNLILWNHSSTYRKSNEYNHPTVSIEAGQPDKVCVSYTHDRDFGIFRDYPVGKEHFKGRGWCPPQSAEYEGFVVDAPPVATSDLDS